MAKSARSFSRWWRAVIRRANGLAGNGPVVRRVGNRVGMVISSGAERDFDVEQVHLESGREQGVVQVEGQHDRVPWMCVFGGLMSNRLRL